MSGPDNIKNLSMQIGGADKAKAPDKVSENSAPVAQGKGSKILGNGATVNGSGKPEAAAGQALLGMMAENNIVSTNGFSRGNVGKKERVTGEATIETHATALLADGPEANRKFQQLMNLASRGAEFSSGKASPREIEGRQAVMPLEGADAQLGAVLRYAFRQEPITTEAIVKSFRESNE
jgi:hypothetical protein